MHLRRFLFFLFVFSSTCTLWGKKVERVVSLAPSITKNIYYLDAGDLLVGCTSYCFDAIADHKEVVASAVTVNLEKTIALQPDLIVVTPLTNPETIELLRKFNIRVEVFPSPKSFEGICEQFIYLGQLLNKEDLARQVVDQSKSKISDLLKGQHLEPTKIFFQIGADPIFTVLPNTFMNDFITMVGGINISENLTKGTVTRESVIAQNPDYIIIATMGVTAEEEKSNWHKFGDLKATQNDHVFLVDADKACNPTPVSFVETLDAIIKMMN